MKSKSLKWVRVGTHGMQADSYRVGKFIVGGIVSYQVCHDWTVLGSVPTWDEAQKVAQDHAEGRGNLPPPLE